MEKIRYCKVCGEALDSEKTTCSLCRAKISDIHSSIEEIKKYNETARESILHQVVNSDLELELKLRDFYITKYKEEMMLEIDKVMEKYEKNKDSISRPDLNCAKALLVIVAEKILAR